MTGGLLSWDQPPFYPQLSFFYYSVIYGFLSLSYDDPGSRDNPKKENDMDILKIGRYIQHLRKAAGMTQKELAEKLSISFQAVSKWENGDALPDTALLPELCDILGTTADQLLRGGALAAGERRPMRAEDVVKGFQYMEDMGTLFGEGSTFFTGMVEGINAKMNIDLLAYLKDPKAREVLYAEALIQGILSGRTVDTEEIGRVIHSEKMRETIRRYLTKAGEVL